MNKKTEPDVTDPQLPRKRKLPDFQYLESLNDSFYHDHPKNNSRSCICRRRRDCIVVF